MYSNHLLQLRVVLPLLVCASLVLLVPAHPATAETSPMTLAAVLCANVLAAPEYVIENVTVLHTLAPGRIPLWPVWSQSGTRIAFTATDPDLMQGHAWLSEIWAMKVLCCWDPIRLLAESDGATCHSLNFTADDTALLFLDYRPGQFGGMPSLCDAQVAGQETSLEIRAIDLDPSIESGTIYHADIRETPYGTWIVVDVERPGSHRDIVSIYLIPTTASGIPDLSSAVKIVDNIQEIDSARLSLSPSGNELLFAYWPLEHGANIALITDLDRIVSGDDPPITSLSDPRVKIMNDGPCHADAPSWSEDGSLFFYAYDFSGNFHISEMNFDEVDFDVMVVRLQDALAGNLVPTRLQIPGNQGCINASRGGTRIVFGQTGSLGNQVCAATFRISDLMSINEAGVVQDRFVLKDGSGTKLRITRSTVVSNYGTGAGPLRMSVFTPVSPLREAMLMQGLIGIGALRVWTYENLAGGGNPNPQPASFNPPAKAVFSYTDAEIHGLDENELLVYAYNPETGFFDHALPVIAHDPDTNTICVEIESIPPADTGGEKSGEAQAAGSLALGIIDSDGDGLSDGVELRWDGDPEENIYDPIDNPAGTDLNPWNSDTDGDGVKDYDELNFGSNPLDPASAPELPAAGIASLVALISLLTIISMRAKHKRRYAS